MDSLRFRQVHLDFHTSPYINDIGVDFNPKEFAKTLKDAHVNSITCFAKCHHGMCYYPTKVGTMHPNLKFDLLGEMIKACHEEGINVPVYITVGWDEDSAEKHPEWQQVTRNGVLGGKDPFVSFWRHMCLNNREYVDLVLAHTAEILDNYEADGLFYDIIFQIGCICNICKKEMKETGLDPANDEDVRKHDFIAIKNFMEKVSSFIKSKKPDMKIYFNLGYYPDIADTESFSIKEKIKYNTHIEIESLPSGQWGYNHFPIVVNYHNYRNYELVGMTGKFHKSWGDFGTLKNLAALEYECFRMLANGAKCSIGDQLHPSGKLDLTVYKRIGEVYRSVEEKEPWCRDTQKIAEIGVFTAKKDLSDSFAINESDEGAMRMLLELHQPFDFIDSDVDINKYKLVILPDNVLLGDKLANKLKSYIENGGGVILTDQSGLNPEKTGFAIEDFGVRYIGEAPYAPDYLRLEESFRGDIEPMDYCFYEKGSEVQALEGTEVLARIRVPYFNRTYDRFCSHFQTPPDKLTDSPAITKKGKVIYISKPIFRDYIINGPKVYRDIIENCIRIIMPEPLIVSDLPRSAEVTLRKQGERYILHVLNYIPQRKCREIDIIEDKIRLYNVKISVRLSEKPSCVYVAPSKEEIGFDYDGGYVSVTVPEIYGHQMVVFEI